MDSDGILIRLQNLFASGSASRAQEILQMPQSLTQVFARLPGCTLTPKQPRNCFSGKSLFPFQEQIAKQFLQLSRMELRDILCSVS